MKRWEYRIDYNSERDRTSLNKLGNEGWELVSVIYNSNSNSTYYYFKRQIPEASPSTWGDIY